MPLRIEAISSSGGSSVAKGYLPFCTIHFCQFLTGSVSLLASVIYSYFPALNPLKVSEHDQMFCHRVEMCTPDSANPNDPFDKPRSILITTPDTYRRLFNRQCVKTRLTELDGYKCAIMLLPALDLPVPLRIPSPDNHNSIMRADEQIVIAWTDFNDVDRQVRFLNQPTGLLRG